MIFPRPPAAIACLVTAHLVLGVAHVALLPPWEGFDEPAHYSSLQQVGDAHQLPRLGKASISIDVADYARMAPMPYSSVPPMERNGGMTYKSFFNSPDTVARVARAVHQRPAIPRRYVPANPANWEAQHPPLYYALLAPAYLATADLSWAMQLLGLRLASYLFAWGALVLGCYTCLAIVPRVADRDTGVWMALGVALWPVVIPSWFPEMARLGNDSLCALIVAGVWLITILALAGGLTYRRAIALGSVLGLGCLTKALFVPVTLGSIGFWTLRQWRLARSHPAPARWGPVVVTAALVVGIAGWWYVESWREYGVVSGAIEPMLVHQLGGLTRLAQAFSLAEWIRGHAEYVITFAWSGTWSLARPPYLVLLPLVAGIFAAAIGYLIALPGLRPAAIARLPVWLALPVVVGFSYHVLLRLALTGKGVGTSGYYMHFLVVPLASGLGLWLGLWWAWLRFRMLAAALVAYAALFAAAMCWAQVLLFAGVLFKSGDRSFYQTPTTLPPWLGLPEALRRLEALAFPRTGVVACILGGVLVVLGVVGAWRMLSNSWDRGDGRRPDAGRHRTRYASRQDETVPAEPGRCQRR